MTTPPPPAAGAAPQRGDRTALWGWLGIVLGLLCCGLLGVIFGVLSLQEAGRDGGGKALGIVAIVCGLVNILGGSIFAGTGGWWD